MSIGEGVGEEGDEIGWEEGMDEEGIKIGLGMVEEGIDGEEVVGGREVREGDVGGNKE